MGARRSVGVAWVAASMMLCALPASAEAGREAIAWVYRAPPECPSADVFRREFSGRTTRAELAIAPVAAARSFDVTLTNDANRATGRIEIRQAGSSASTREVVGRTCREVVSALSLIAALAVDPQASLAPASELAVSPAPEQPPPTDNEVPHGTDAASRWVVATGFDAGATGGLFPNIAPMVSVFAEVALWRASPVAPAMRLSVEGALGSSLAPSSGSARFRWLAAAFDGCPLRIRLADTLHARPCVLVEAGVLQGEGLGVTDPLTQSRRWVALGGSGKVQWTLGKRFFLEAGGTLRFPLARDTFVFEVPGRVVVHAVPAVLGAASVGIGLHFP